MDNGYEHHEQLGAGWTWHIATLALPQCTLGEIMSAYRAAVEHAQGIGLGGWNTRMSCGRMYEKIVLNELAAEGTHLERESRRECIVLKLNGTQYQDTIDELHRVYIYYEVPESDQSLAYSLHRQAILLNLSAHGALSLLGGGPGSYPPDCLFTQASIDPYGIM